MKLLFTSSNVEYVITHHEIKIEENFLNKPSDHDLVTNCNESLQLSILTEMKKTSWKQVCQLILVVLFQSLILVHEKNISHT